MNNLMKIRQFRRISRRELSERTGIPSRTIEAWERGQNNIENAAYISIMKLSRALDVEPDELFGGDSDARE